MGNDDWSKLKLSACRLMRIRGQNSASDILERIPFEIRNGTNSFGDDFSVLYYRAPLEKYVEMGKHERNLTVKYYFSIIAKVISEIGPFIRFVTVELDTKSGPSPVISPTLLITSDAVERALDDAQHLLASQGATSAVDRAHTAFHGYLKAVCSKEAIDVEKDDSITELYKQILKKHPRLKKVEPSDEDTKKIGRAVANILDAINSLRNHASLAHANENLLQEAEAMLVINAVRTLLHYLDAKLG